MQTQFTRDKNIIMLRLLTISLLVLAVGIAAGNYGLGGSLSPAARELFHTLYMLFEHIFRAITVFLGSLLTYRFLKKRKGSVSPRQKTTLLSFSLSALVLLVIWPLASGYWELYNSLMPFPWATLPFQLSVSGTYFGKPIPGWQGIDGTTLLLWAYFSIQVIILAGTLILGRKWWCSMLCLMNGCHAESLGIALPLIVHNRQKPQSKQIHPRLRQILRKLQLGLFTVNMLLILLWTIYALSGKSLIPENTLLKIESIKYISLELTLMMFLWLFIGGRGYCYYCPAGFALGIIGNLAGQRIRTGLSHCTHCGACNAACKLSIDIQAMATQGKDVRALQCVGCGLCTDACPTGNIRYTTFLLDKWHKPSLKN